MNLLDYDMVVINSSAGKDSLCSIFELVRLAKKQCYPLSRIVVSHQDLGVIEWPGTKDLARHQAEFFGLKIYYSKRRNAEGIEEDLLQYVQRRGKWPSNKQRYCTSDFKRGPGARVVVQVSKNLGKCKILHVFGFRREESPARAKKQALKLNERLTTKNRKVYDFLPILEWPVEKVWKTIRNNDLPYHYAYDLGMPRLSCCFCIFSPADALLLAAHHNLALLQRYIDVERKIDHWFRKDQSIQGIGQKIHYGHGVPDQVKDWRM